MGFILKAGMDEVKALMRVSGKEYWTEARFFVEISVMFTLDEKIEKATLDVATISGPSSGLNCRLMNDDRYFWVLIIPEIDGIGELHDLAPDDAAHLAALTRHLSEAIKVATGCDKINTAAIGNVVPMLHIHVVARHHGDEAWPHPVWGRGKAKKMSKTIEDWRLAVLKDALARFNPEVRAS